MPARKCSPSCLIQAKLKYQFVTLKPGDTEPDEVPVVEETPEVDTPFPDWGVVNVVRFSKEGYQNDRGIQTAFTKRFSHNWEMQGTY